MCYTTNGEFIQDVRDYANNLEKIKDINKSIKDIEYQLYNKVKSPLDYDVVGYENGETLRAIKGGRRVSDSEISSIRENLNKKLDELSLFKNAYKKRIDRVNKTLEVINEPLRTIILERYMEKKTLKYIVRKYPMLFSNEMSLVRYLDRGIEKSIKKIPPTA